MGFKVKVDASEWKEFGLNLTRAARDMPELRSAVLLDIRTVLRSELEGSYISDVPPGLTKPTRTTGLYGRLLRIFISPNANWITIRADGPNAQLLEFGGSRSDVTFEEIQDWFETKFSVSNDQDIGGGPQPTTLAIRTIVNRLKSRGMIPHLIITRVLTPNNPRGIRFAKRFEQVLRTGLDLYLVQKKIGQQGVK